MVEGNGGKDDRARKLSQRLAHNLKVAGSNPAPATNKYYVIPMS